MSNIDIHKNYRRKEKVLFHDDRIRRVQPNKYRLKLTLNDLQRVDVVGEGVERVGVFYDEPINYGELGVFYRKKIGREPFMLNLLIKRLVYLNEGINDAGLKRMISTLIPRFIKFVDGEPVVKHEEFSYKYRVLEGSLPFTGWSELELPYDLVTAYPYDSTLSVKEKIQITTSYRGLRMAELMSEVIHTAAQTVIGKKIQHLIISKSALLPYTAESTPSVKSINTLNKHILGKTETMLSESAGGHFATEATAEKYLKYLDLPEMSLNQAVKTLRVSKSTIQKFKKIEELKE